VDAAFNNVQMFDGDGRLLLVFGEFGNLDGQVWMPAGIAIDGSDRIYLADRYNDRIQVFQYMGDSAREASGAAEDPETDAGLPAQLGGGQ